MAITPKKVLLAIFGSFFVDASKIVDDVVNVGSNLSFFNLGHFCLLTSPFGKNCQMSERKKKDRRQDFENVSDIVLILE